MNQSSTVSKSSPSIFSDSSFSVPVEAFRQERKSASPDLVNWQYVHHARDTDEQNKLFQWNGKQSLLDWIKVMGACRLMQSSVRLEQSLLDESNACYEKIFQSLGQRFDVHSLNLQNAFDFQICTLLPHIRSVLDYGAGHARQSFLFSRIPGVTVFENDAVETSYFSQHWVLKTLGFPLWDYFDQPSTLQEFLAKKESKVVHLPTWQNDLIPDRSLDLVMFIWSFSEMSEAASAHAIKTCIKKLREGGYVYLRDEPHSHGMRMEKQFILNGFLPVFQSWTLADTENISGSPRLYRYMPKYLNKRNTQYCGFLFTTWKKRTFSLKQMLVRLKRLMPF